MIIVKFTGWLKISSSSFIFAIFEVLLYFILILYERGHMIKKKNPRLH